MFKQNQELKEYFCLYREADNFYHEIALQIGLSDSAFFILFFLLENGEGCLQKDICQMCSISKQTIHSAIKKLEKVDVIYIKQVKKDKRIYLTSYGHELLNKKIMPIALMENAAFEEMDIEERRELVRLTKKYLTFFKEKVTQL